MVFNPSRRAAIADAALVVLGRDGARALTHRAVDASASLPVGTAANYFPSRAHLLLGVAQRVFEALRPEPERLDPLMDLPPTDAFPAYVAYVVERLIGQPELGRALLELRLEAARSPDLLDLLGEFLRSGVAADLEFHVQRGLPGGRQLIIDTHHLVNGVMLDFLTVTVDPEADPVETARRLAVVLARASRAT